MTKISTDEVRALAQLSALRLSDDEAASLSADLERILGYFELLGELDTEGVEPTYYGMDLTNVASEDSVADAKVSREELLALSGENAATNQIKVPQVL